MKSDHFFLALIATVLISFSGICQPWTQKQSFPGFGRYGVQVFSINGFGYLGGTGGSGATLFTDIYQYDPVTDNWTTKASFPGSGRRVGIGFETDSYGFVGCGWNGTSTLYDFYRYNPISNSWSQMTNYPGGGGRNCFNTGASGKGYVGGGSHNLGTAQSDWWEYEPDSNQWNQLASFPFGGRLGGACFSIGNIIYICCGYNGTTTFNDMWAYDISLNSWSQKSSFPGNIRFHPSSFVVNGQAIVGGGYIHGTGAVYDDYYRYDPTLDSWSVVAGFSAGKRAVSEGFSINGKGYVAAGWDSSNIDLNDLWMYDDSTCQPISSWVYRVGNQLSALNSGSQFKFQWLHCDTVLTPLLGDTNRLFTPKQNGSYAVIESKNGCSDTSSCFDVYWLGIEKFSEEDVKVYPNPVSDIIYIDGPYLFFDYELVDIRGTILDKGNIDRNQIFSGDLKKGVYFIRIRSNHGIITRKIVVQ